jgi:hypothetical protein
VNDKYVATKTYTLEELVGEVCSEPVHIVAKGAAFYYCGSPAIGERAPLFTKPGRRCKACLVVYERKYGVRP